MRWRLAVVSFVLAVASPVLADKVDAVDSSGWTPLQQAAVGGDLAKIKALLARGASLEASSPTVYGGATPLVIALEFSRDEAAMLLLDRGASVNGKAGRDALVLAARGGFDPIVDRLLAKRVPVAGTFALHAAARYGHVTTIRRLIKAGAKVTDPQHDDHDYTAFIVACQENQLEAARALLAAGAQVNDIDGDGTPALHWAVFAARPVERHLYEHLGQPHTTQFIPQPTAPLVALLARKGARLNAVDAQGNTALHQAAMMDARAAAAVLVRAGASQTLRNADGKTARELAQDRGNSVVDVLRP